MFEDVPGVHEVKAFVVERQVMGIPAHVSDAATLDSRSDLHGRLLQADDMDAGGRLRHRCSQNAKPAADLQDPHAGSNVQEIDECLVRQAIQRGETLLFGWLRPVDVGHGLTRRPGLMILPVTMKRGLCTLAIAVGLAGPLLGQSAGSYRISTTWAQLPPGVEWGKVIAVACDDKDNVWILRRSEPSVLVLTADGKFVKSWGQGLFAQGAHFIHVDHDGFVWTTDNVDNTVYKFDQNGKLLMTLGKRGVAGDNTSRDLFDGPSSVAVAPNGDFFVTDGYRNSRMVKFSKDGTFIKVIGGVKGNAPGQFDLPHAVVVDAMGRLIVSDRNNKRVQILDQDGRFIEQWPDLNLVRPAGLIAAADGTVYVSDTNPEGATIKVVRNGKVASLIGGLDGLPHFIAMDRSGALYMADARVGGEIVKKLVK